MAVKSEKSKIVSNESTGAGKWELVNYRLRNFSDKSLISDTG